jgi:hypothetical protein
MGLEELSGKTSWGILLRVKIAAGKLLPVVGRRRRGATVERMFSRFLFLAWRSSCEATGNSKAYGVTAFWGFCFCFLFFGIHVVVSPSSSQVYSDVECNVKSSSHLFLKFCNFNPLATQYPPIAFCEWTIRSVETVGLASMQLNPVFRCISPPTPISSSYFRGLV